MHIILCPALAYIHHKHLHSYLTIKCQQNVHYCMEILLKADMLAIGIFYTKYKHIRCTLLA